VRDSSSSKQRFHDWEKVDEPQRRPPPPPRPPPPRLAEPRLLKLRAPPPPLFTPPNAEELPERLGEERLAEGEDLLADGEDRLADDCCPLGRDELAEVDGRAEAPPGRWPAPAGCVDGRAPVAPRCVGCVEAPDQPRDWRVCAEAGTPD